MCNEINPYDDNVAKVMLFLNNVWLCMCWFVSLSNVNTITADRLAVLSRKFRDIVL